MKPFDEPSIFDELRRYTTGAMSPDERASFDANLARDPELAKLAVEFGAAWSVTEGAFQPTPVSHTRFDEIVERVDLGQPTTLTVHRRVAAAAVLVLCAAIAWLAWRNARAPLSETVELHAIPWRPNVPIAAENKALPALLGDWSPVQNGQIRWLDSMDDARAVSAAVSRPIFVYGYVESCPICQGFQKNQFQDPEIQALVERSVPVRIDLMKLDEEEAQSIYARRYPLLEMQNERGEILHTFAGSFDQVDIRAELASAVASSAGPNWKLVHDLVAAYARARSAESAGRIGEATIGFSRLASNDDLPAFAAVGGAGMSRLAASAERVLDDAQRSASNSDGSAFARFELESSRFAGTPYESDLEAVARAWRALGHFPELIVHE